MKTEVFPKTEVKTGYAYHYHMNIYSYIFYSTYKIGRFSKTLECT